MPEIKGQGGNRRRDQILALRLKRNLAQLYRRGVNVTINSDDVLIFDSDVSKEYLRLYQSGCLTAEELNDIRLSGLD